LTLQEELKQVAEKHAKLVPALANCEVTLKIHQAECRDVWVLQKTHFEGKQAK